MYAVFLLVFHVDQKVVNCRKSYVNFCHCWFLGLLYGRGRAVLICRVSPDVGFLAFYFPSLLVRNCTFELYVPNLLSVISCRA
jgi:hypothetical protein